MSYRRETVQKLLALIGCEQITVGGKWINATCPWARFSHEGGRDKSPSFGVHLNGYARCFSCRPQAVRVIDMVWDLAEQYAHDKAPFHHFNEALALASDEADIALLDNPVWGVSESQPIPWDEQYLDQFPVMFSGVPSVGEEYVLNRGISPRVGQQLGMRWDPEMYRVCFPVRDWSGHLMGLRGRALYSELKHYSYPGPHNKRNEMIWGNEHAANLNNPLLLVEGHFDLASILPLYQNVLVAMSVSITPLKLARLASAVSLHTLFDPGQGGDSGRKLVWETFRGKIPVRHHYLKGGDPNEVSTETLRECLGGLA